MQATGVMEMGYIYEEIDEQCDVDAGGISWDRNKEIFPYFSSLLPCLLLYVESQHYHKRNYTVLYMLIYLLWWCLHARYIGLSSARCEPRRKQREKIC